jgi:hypothetical protein
MGAGLLQQSSGQSGSGANPGVATKEIEIMVNRLLRRYPLQQGCSSPV